MIYQNNKPIGLTIDNTSNREVYSTEEQVIGTWIDGKPLYRKAYTVNAITSADNKSHFITISNFDHTVVNMYGNMQAMNWASRYILPYFEIQGEGILVYSYSFGWSDNSPNPNTLWINYFTKYSTPATFEIVAEYTKTTDEPTIQLNAQPLSLAEMKAAYAIPVTTGGVYNEENEEGTDE